MLGKIRDELAKKIATQIYDYAKTQGAQIVDGLKNTNLKANGAGLPPPLVVEFHELFVNAVWQHSGNSHGFTKWPYQGKEHEFRFLLRKPLIDKINAGANWVKAAERTADGVRQIAAMGGAAGYKQAVSYAIESVFDYTVAKYVGVIYEETETSFWVLLSKVMSKPVALQGTSNFEPAEFFYWTYGDRATVERDLKISKAVMTTGSLWWKEPAPPSAGPFLRRPA